MAFNKTLVAASTLVACGAFAQSSVTINGFVDAGVSHGSGSVANTNQVTSGNNSTSRLIIRGQEDLGGSLHAGFWLEGQFATDSGIGAASNTNNQTSGLGTAGGLTFNRRASVSIADNWGEIRLGRDAAAHFYDRWESDPFIAIGAGATQAFVSSLAGLVGVRVSNAVSYFLPDSLGGWFGQAQYYLGENPSNAANAHDGTGVSLRLGWASQAWKVSVHHARTDYTTGDIATSGIAAAYSAAAFRLMGGLFRDHVGRPGNTTGNGFTLGVIVPIGASDFKAAISKYRVDTGAQPETRKLALGYVYNFSKRTAAYGTYARVSNSGGATRAINGAVTGANQGSSGFDIGIRHTF
jgi:predicted porin